MRSPSRGARTWALFAASLLCLNACGGGESSTEPAAGGKNPAVNAGTTPVPVEWSTATSRAGRYDVSWRPVGGPIPLNEPFELDVEVRNKGEQELIRNANLSVIAEMPAHGHGMLREPRASLGEDGRYRVKGMLMHMTGRWVLSIDVIVDSVSESTDFEVILE